MTFSICFIIFIITSLFGVISMRSFQNRAQLVSASILISNLNFPHAENRIFRNYRMRTFRNMRNKWADRGKTIRFVISIVENPPRTKYQLEI